MRITSGSLKNRKLVAPKGTQTRPTLEIVRKSIFDALGPSGATGTFLDLFAGSGAMSFEAISRGFSHAYLIENSFEAIKAIKKNITDLNIEKQITLYKRRAQQQVVKLKGYTFDMIFIDPPYEKEVDESTEKLSLATLKQVDTLKLLATSGTLIIETTKKALPENFEEELNNLRLVKTRVISDTLIYEFAST